MDQVVTSPQVTESKLRGAWRNPILKATFHLRVSGGVVLLGNKYGEDRLPREGDQMIKAFCRLQPPASSYQNVPPVMDTFYKASCASMTVSNLVMSRCSRLVLLT